MLCLFTTELAWLIPLGRRALRLYFPEDKATKLIALEVQITRKSLISTEGQIAAANPL